MQTSTPAMSKQSIWAGRIISGLVVVLLLFDAFGKVMKLALVVEGTVHVGYPTSTIVPIGVVLLLSTVVYIIPRTSVLGAILLTGYLGGAVATNVRISSPLFSFILAPVYVGILVWAGLYLRDEQVRALIPLRRATPSVPSLERQKAA